MSESKAITRADVFSAADTFSRERVEVPQWGGHVYVRQLSAKEFEEWQEWAIKHPSKSARVAMILDCVCDEGGAPLFDETNDINDLCEHHSNAVIELLWSECRRVNCLDAKSREDAEKN